MKKVILIVVLLGFLISGALCPVNSAKANGCRTDLNISWYANSGTAYQAMLADGVDMISGGLTKEQKEAVEADPNLQIASIVGNDMSELDLNNNLTIADYPTSTNPCSVLAVRQAIASLVSKDYAIANILLYFGSRIDAPVCTPQTAGWVDPNVVTFDFNGNGVIDPSEDNYPYPYDVNAAVDYLASLGFSDTDANGYLNYPNNPMWMNAAALDTTQMPLKICIRSDDARPDPSAPWGIRERVGRYLFDQLEGWYTAAGDSILATSPRWAELGLVGGDFDTTDVTWIQPRSILAPIVMGARNYHIYTGGWSLGRFPTYQYNLYHSAFSYPYGSNYVTGGAYPAYDAILNNIYRSASLAEAQTASQEATNYHVMNVVTIPLWSYVGYVAWRKELAGIVNMKPYGLLNDWTFLNAWRTKTTNPLRVGCVSGWDTLNAMYSQWYFEYALLDRVYNRLINVNPYDLAADIPWAAQDWEVGTWIDPRDGLEKTAVTYYLNKGVGCAEPVTGGYAGRFNATDYLFTAWYNYAYDDSWQWSSFMDIHHIDRINDYTVKVYFESKSIWFVYAPVYPLLGPSTILEPMLCTASSATFTGADLVESPPGYYEYGFTTDRVVSVTSATVNGSPMTEGVDYYIRAGYDAFTHNIFVPLRAFAPTDTIVINYNYATPNGAGGAYLGGNLGYDWMDTMYAYGYYYPVSISISTAALSKNWYFFLETSPKGEIDFRWTKTGTTYPHGGYFKIDILDVVKCTGSYCTRGDGAYSPVYNPGADLDDTDLCHVGILDVVTITGKYAQTWGQSSA